MKSHREQSLLIGQNNSVTSLSALSIINIRRSMEHMKIKGLVDALFLQIGLKRNEKYKLEEIIKAAQDKNIEIVSVCNHIFPEDFNTTIKGLATTQFEKKIFGTLFTDSVGERDEYIDLLEIMDDEYVLSTIDAKTVNSVSNPKMILYIRGNRVDKDNTVRAFNDIVMTISFSN